MGFLDRNRNDPTPQQPGGQQAQPAADGPHSEEYRAGSLEGLPQSGRERLERMREDIARGFFTSDLSVNEFLLVKEAGFEPLGLVLGSSIYHIGFQQASWNQNQELNVLTQAMYHARQGMLQSMRQIGRNVEMANFTQALYDARELAMGRMQAEAEETEAGGLVGVRLNQASHGWGSHVIEFMAIATAVIPTRDDHTIEKPALVLPLNG
jgi:uncharacterized protein YbjQ (UPF0145 family)